MKEISFDGLPAQPPINLRADAYAETALRLSRLAMMTTRHVRDIAYGEDYWQRLDLYLPDKEGLKDLPVFVNIHGGGWTHGYKEWMGLNAPAIVALPALYVSLSYRLAPAVRFPEPLHDCLAGLKWVHANIAGYGGDPGRIFLGGHSAGAHLSSLATLRVDLHERFGLPPNLIKACFPYSGVCDLTMEGADGARIRVPSTLPLVPGERDDLVREASPLTYAGPSTTPFLVTWAENDNAHCKAQGPIFLDALRKSNARAEGWMFPLFDHFWIHVDQQRPENRWTRTLKAWMLGDPKTAAIFAP